MHHPITFGIHKNLQLHVGTLYILPWRYDLERSYYWWTRYDSWKENTPSVL